jgi:transcription initiation factor IIE alpha subunit
VEYLSNNQIMKKLSFLMSTLFLATTCIFAQKAGRIDTLKHTSYYYCPNHQEVTGHEPGKCPKCGMQMNISAKEQMKAKVVKNFSCPAHLDVTKHHPGKCPKCGKKLSLSPKEQMKAQVLKTYTCSMHPEIALDKEGNCPKCGKSLTEKKADQ